MMMMMTMIYAV